MPLRKIMIIRHAEKPVKEQAMRGVDPAGRRGDDNLTVRGWQRAGALVGLFAPHDARSARTGINRPAAIFAAGAEKAGKSRRSVQTVSPLAAALGLTIDDTLKATEEDRLAASILRLDGPVLVAWEHDAIARIVEVVTEGAATAPQWPDDRFDLVFVLDRDARRWQFTQVTQRLLAGDSGEPIR